MISLFFVLFACSTSNPTPEAVTPAPAVAPAAVAPTSTASSAATGHADPTITPGSHEDWCGEHAVPESQCTRCNASLVAAFKATNDWCEEHALPESQCLTCNPDLKIERPPKKPAN